MIMVNRRKIAALVISLVLHAGLLAAVVFYDVLRVFRSVEGFEIGDYGGRVTVTMINPADYGYGRKPRLAPTARRAKPLKELKRREKLAEQKADRASKADEDAEARRKVEQASEQEPADARENSLKFGRLDTSPIKRHVAALWQAREQGRVNLPGTFSITAVCEVNPDGSFSAIRVVESSGSEELDRTALAILTEISNQHAFAPLSRLSSLSAKLDVGADSANLSLTGFASSSAIASDMAGQYRHDVVGRAAFRIERRNARTAWTRLCKKRCYARERSP